MNGLPMRFVAALLLTYAVSRLLRRLPIAAAEPTRSYLVHGAAALLAGGLVLALRQEAAAVVPTLLAQGIWLLVDRARSAPVTARAGQARAGQSARGR